MGVLADRLDGARATATTSGGTLSAELTNRDEIAISFFPGSYYTLDERRLEMHLAELFGLLWQAWLKEYYAALSEVVEQTITGEPPPLTEREVAFDEARDNMMLRASSLDGRIRIGTRGMREWKVSVADGTIAIMREEAFAAALRDAAQQIWQQSAIRVRELKREHFSG